MRQRIPTGNEDNDKVQCKRCGFWCDLQRDKRGSGSGVLLTATTISGRTLYDPEHASGCPFCNTKAYLTWQR